MTGNILLIVNAVACALTALCLMMFRRRDKAHHTLASWCAYLMIIACASVTIRILAGQYHSQDLSEVCINVLVCICVLLAKGNISRLVTKSDKNTA